MNRFLLIILFAPLLSCQEDRPAKEYPMDKEPLWAQNEILRFGNDTLISVFYGDTITCLGPLQYGTLHYSNGKTFHGEKVIPKNNESYHQMLKRLRSARSKYYKHCEMCGDLNSSSGSLQNFEIIKTHTLHKLGRVDSALNYLIQKEQSWESSSRYADLYIGLLVEKFGLDNVRDSVELRAKNLDQDSVLLYSHWIQWQPIAEYNYKTYQDSVNWKHYFRLTLKRIQEDGI